MNVEAKANQSTLERIDQFLCLIESIAIVVFSLIALFLGVLQVILRYGFNTGIHWSEGVLVVCVVWAMLLAGSRAVRDGLHVRVDIVPLLLPERARMVCAALAILTSFALCLCFFYCGWLYTQFVYGMNIINPEIGIPDALIYSIVPFSMAMFVVRYVLVGIDFLKNPSDYFGELEVHE